MEFDVENVMAEIKVAAPEFVPFLAWVAERAEEDQVSSDEFQSVIELVYSYARGKNEYTEERMMDARG